jgi:hypothetical protein
MGHLPLEAFYRFRFFFLFPDFSFSSPADAAIAAYWPKNRQDQFLLLPSHIDSEYKTPEGLDIQAA